MRANERAQKTFADAIEESDRLYQEVREVRERVLAATRAAYYNAMQFRMSLAERFSAMEHDIDNAISILRILDIPQVPERAHIAERSSAMRDDEKRDEAVKTQND